MQRKHRLVQVNRARRLRKRSNEVTQVTPCLLNVARRAIGFEYTMTSDHGFRMQGLDCVERAQPLLRGLLVTLREIEVRVVVDGIPRYNQTDGRHIQPG